ncbi:MAG: 2-oxoglutarate dehydrogenase E1 subunit family protein, partial [Chitinophagaceae bacterium]
MKDFSYITNAHPSFIESQYQDFAKNPSSIDPELRKFFEGFDFALNNGKSVVNGASPIPQTGPLAEISGADWKKELGAYRLILGYRNKGHLIARTNPVRTRKDRGANLNLSFFGLSEADIDQPFFAGNLIGLGTTSLRNILDHLNRCYANHVGIEFKYISNQEKVDFLTNEMEKNFLNPLPL